VVTLTPPAVAVSTFWKATVEVESVYGSMVMTLSLWA
jgi:hypothetical protein